MTELVSGMILYHTKSGKFYYVIGVAKSYDGIDMMIYKDKSNQLWYRPVSEVFEVVTINDREYQRFQVVSIHSVIINKNGEVFDTVKYNDVWTHVSARLTSMITSESREICFNKI